MGSFFDLNFQGVKKVFNIRFFIIIVIICAVMFIMVGITKQSVTCPAQEIKYIYVPHSFEEQQTDVEPVSETFSKLFTEPSPWISRVIAGETTYI